MRGGVPVTKLLRPEVEAQRGCVALNIKDEETDRLARQLAAATCRAADRRLEVSARTLLARPPLESDPAHPLVLSIREANASGPRCRSPIEGASHWADFALMANAGVPTTLFGPAGEGAHAAEEWVSLSSTFACAHTVPRAAQLQAYGS